MHTHPCPESLLALKELRQLYMDYVQQGPEKKIVRSTTKHSKDSAVRSKYIQGVSVVSCHNDRLASSPLPNLKQFSARSNKFISDVK